MTTGRRKTMVCVAALVAALLAALIVGSFTGCRKIEPFLNMRPVEVRDYAPRERFVEPGTVEEITVRFSASMNRTRTETALRVEDDAGTVGGQFHWRRNDTEVVFQPHAGFARGVQYNVTVSDSAEDRYGNNLLRELIFGFRTGQSERAPYVVRHRPIAGAEEIPETVLLEFSEAMQRDTVYRALSITPRISTAASWSECRTVVTLTPTEPFTRGIRYEVHLNSDAKDVSGNQLSQDLRFSFRTGKQADSSPPVVRLQRNGAPLLPIDEAELNRIGVEKNERFEILFPEPVTASRRANAVTLTPSVTVAAEWNTDYNRVYVHPLAFLEWEELYELNVLGTRYRFLVDGADSQPIRVAGVALSSSAAPGSEAFTVLSLGDSVTLFEASENPGLKPASNDDIALDLVLHHAPTATISRGALMNSFRIGSAGGSITFTAREMIMGPRDSPFLSAPDRTVVRFLLRAQNQGTLPVDLLSIELRPGVHDSLGNTLVEGFRLEVNTW